LSLFDSNLVDNYVLLILKLNYFRSSDEMLRRKSKRKEIGEMISKKWDEFYNDNDA